ncbi:MAG: 7-cyano-7-deazaguanine synthase QueC [Myxococcales bacterium]|nr:7-cyano-7-deazaguanine synthase QueC [Myxococcales bacterium]|tara:strand:+ start:2593 stop:3282 length:690 start_codon:yes stop_codon:yes gene_type:complete
MPKAVILSSGGLDSTTCLAMAIDMGYEPITLTFDYGQRHRIELDAAKEVGEYYGVKQHIIADIGLFRDIGQSALTDAIEVPKNLSVDDLSNDIPVTYVPARNLVFLAMATGVAETQGASDIFIGVNALDYSGYPDCRPEFINAFSTAANLATKAGSEGTTVRIQTPLIHLSKSEIIKAGHALDAPYHLTHSCYAPTNDNESCGQCDSCLLRLKGFADASLVDPISYAGT